LTPTTRSHTLVAPPREGPLLRPAATVPATGEGHALPGAGATPDEVPRTVPPLRIAVYYPWLHLTSGAERTVLELARRSAHSVTVFTNEYQPDATFPGLREVDVRVLPRVPVERSIRAVARAATQLLTQRLDLTGFDALLVVCEGLGDLVALKERDVPSYCLCLTPLRVVFDPVYRAEYLARRGPLARLAVRVGGEVFRAVDRLAWKRYRRVAVISEEVARRAVAGGLARREGLDVLHPGVDLTRFGPPATGEPERTFFVPGRIMWTKNLELAIAAFRRFRELVDDPAGWRLRIAGTVDHKSQGYYQRLRELAGEDAGIEFLVHPSDERMRAEYERCYSTLFTALNEDWGLVMIEALACGKPVVATDRGGPREIVRDEVDGLLADPTPEAFAQAMARLARDPALRARLSAAGPAGASRFGWDTFVQRLDGMIEADLRGAARRGAPAAAGMIEEMA
jgi:glycosyltransferase involved in cell wall biosynthesis